MRLMALMIVVLGMFVPVAGTGERLALVIGINSTR